MATALRLPLLGIGAMLLVSVAAAGTARYWVAEEQASLAPAAASRDLWFADRPDGSVAVRDSAGATIAVLPPGNDGFIRGALRGLSRERRRMEADLDTPYRLTDWTDGRLTLEDRATGRSVDLRAFGATNAAAFGRLLTARVEDVR